MASEEQVAGASYVMNFLNDVENLTNTYATYLNVMVRIQDKYQLGKKEKEENKKKNKTVQLDNEDEQAVLEVNEAIRVWIARCYVKANTLQVKIPEMKESVKKLKKNYESAISSSMIEKEVAEGFVMDINAVFMQGILKDILTRAQDVYEDVLR